MLALVTPTGGRPMQIQLCAEFMRHQDYKGKVLWVIVDDVVPYSTENICFDFPDKWKIVNIYPPTKWKPGMNTQAGNLLIGLDILDFYNVSAIFIIEDDDYYSPQYLRVMSEKLKGYDVVGQRCTVYYNPVIRGWMRNANINHASLFQIAFTPDVLPRFRSVCESRNKYIDMTFFRTMQRKGVHLFNGQDLAVGIKGLPGRAGIGMGHRAEIKMEADPEFVKLKELIGEDWIYYSNLQ
jgi:hypothetical protein